LVLRCLKKEQAKQVLLKNEIKIKISKLEAYKLRPKVKQNTKKPPEIIPKKRGL
jgi:hypothetical protein